MTAQHTPGPWHLGPHYGIFKGHRRVLEGDGSTTTEERQSIVDSLNRDYTDDAERAKVADLLAACKHGEAALLGLVHGAPLSTIKAALSDLRSAIARAEGVTP
jgi:hypothetical protein